MPAPAALLHTLRAQLARIERATGEAPPAVPLGAWIDGVLPERGLARGAIHEVQAVDAAAGLAFCGLVLGRSAGDILWIAPQADAVWAPGLQALGLDVSRLIVAHYRRPAEGLWAMEEALRCASIGGVVLCCERMDMTASRRLQLAAEAAGGLGLLLRSVAVGQDHSGQDHSGQGHSGQGRSGQGHSSQGNFSAASRWRIASLAHHGLKPRWRLDLLRCRAVQPASWDTGWVAGQFQANPWHEARPA